VNLVGASDCPFISLGQHNPSFPSCFYRRWENASNENAEDRRIWVYLKKWAMFQSRSGERAILFRPFQGLENFPPVPTAHAVGYLLTLLRSYFSEIPAISMN